MTPANALRNHETNGAVQEDEERDAEERDAEEVCSDLCTGGREAEHDFGRWVGIVPMEMGGV